ncbi:hypothetical protein Patl1_06919 [Pistacia atlantica]|uniref:Uncharacterized protein n=1 Tax=Pistacia atlantica TaxID=434234 RepID=A0ACC1AIT8_9ROSI|nr:hypothetical protein Patl1_06919 [Pistacia atlantica]
MPDTIEFTEPQLPMTRSNLSDGFRSRLATFKEGEDSAQGILPFTLENSTTDGDWVGVRSLESFFHLGDPRRRSFTELEKWFEEYMFEEKVKGRGLIIRGWAPQISILSHSATGGFLTHCGWNSTLEGVSSEKPMITWPMFAEKFYNEKLLAEVLKIGVRVGVEMSVTWAEKQKVEAWVEKKKIKKAVEMVMDEGDEGEERRRKAKGLGESAKKAVKQGGSSYLNTTWLIQHVMQLQVSHP